MDGDGWTEMEGEGSTVMATLLDCTVTIGVAADVVPVSVNTT